MKTLIIILPDLPGSQAQADKIAIAEGYSTLITKGDQTGVQIDHPGKVRYRYESGGFENAKKRE